MFITQNLLRFALVVEPQKEEKRKKDVLFIAQTRFTVKFLFTLTVTSQELEL